MTNPSYSLTPFDPKLFLDLAKELIATNQDETHYRAAIGRAYYAIFLLARAKTGVVVKRDVHRAVYVAMTKRSDLKAAASQMESLRKLRTAADYNLTAPPIHGTWARNWNTALTLANALLPKIK